MGNKVSMRPYVVYWNNIPSPYMVDRFNALASRGDLNFEAWFNDRIQAERSWIVDESKWSFRYRYLPVIHIGRHSFHFPTPLLGKRPDVLISLYAEPVFLFGWLVAKLRGSKTGFRVLLTHDRWVPRNPMKEAIKRYLFRRVDAIETPGSDGKQFAMRYGTPPDRIFMATHTVDIPHFRQESADALIQRKALREELGIQGTTFLYTGRLWWGKGINYLLEAFEWVQRHASKEVSLLLVGDGPEEKQLRRICAERGIRNVVFAGFLQKEELPRCYAIADVFVFPTLGDPYGLVVDEAMACSLPVISTSAAGEIRDRVEEGANGYIVPPEDSATLADRMMRFVDKPDLCKEMGDVSAQKVAGHTPEQWAKDFEEIVQKLVKE